MSNVIFDRIFGTLRKENISDSNLSVTNNVIPLQQPLPKEQWNLIFEIDDPTSHSYINIFHDKAKNNLLFETTTFVFGKQEIMRSHLNSENIENLIQVLKRTQKKLKK